MPIVAVIADIHIGHRAAMWPDNYTDCEGKHIIKITFHSKQNPLALKPKGFLNDRV